MVSPYVELRARSAFSFLRGASQPEDLALHAARLGYSAVALGDHGGLYGVPRFHAAAREAGLRALVAADLDVQDIGSLRLLVENAQGYRNLCRLLTLAHAGREKGTHLATLQELAAHVEGLYVLLGACRDVAAADRVARRLGKRAVAEVQRHLDPSGERRNRAMVQLAKAHGLLLVATGDVRHATPAERRVLDVLTCIREGVTLERAGTLLSRNADRHLHPPEEMARRFADLPQALRGTVELAERCAFTLDALPYEFPRYPTQGETEQALLARLTWEGARRRYGERLDGKVRAQLEHELALIEKLRLAGYFLIVWDLVRFCGERGILTQGRGSAANSAVCYSLGITAVDPVGMGLLFERFLSEERGEWPDIDLDLPSGDKREQVIQYVYDRYGRSSAAMCAEVITYRGRSAVREVGKVLGLPEDAIARLAKSHGRFEFDEDETRDPRERLEQVGLPPDERRLRLLLDLCAALRSLPRHLSQHSGGMILAKGRLDEIVPLEPAAMAQRTVIQWDKDDCEALGLIKIDLLGLGMMAALEESMEILAARGTPQDLAQLPHDDPAVYEAACRADTVGVFQIESRAQMATLPRLQPRRFYDLVVSVGLIRPGPIVGKMVHPYLNRRAGREAVRYPHPSLEPVLARTLGVPLFQEQLMRVAMVAAGFTGGEAQELRRAMSHKRSTERMRRFETRLREGMQRNRYSPEAIEEVITGIRSFAEYGFPESHAASFALLVYASLWLKVHHPAVFLTALLNNQPMGFYAPATLIQDAKRHGVRVRPVCVLDSEARCRVLGDREVRLGFNSVIGMGKEAAERLVRARRQRPFRDVADVCLRGGLDVRRAERLAEAGAFAGLGVSRRRALWEVRAVLAAGGPLAPPPQEEASPLPEMDALERLWADYAATGVTVGPHLVAKMRKELDGLRVTPAGRVPAQPNGRWIRIAGHVIVRQRPGTAKGMLFITVEDESGFANAVVEPRVFEENRMVILGSPLLLIEGPLQNLQGVATVKARRFLPLRGPSSEDLPPSHDFR